MTHDLRVLLPVGSTGLQRELSLGGERRGRDGERAVDAAARNEPCCGRDVRRVLHARLVADPEGARDVVVGRSRGALRRLGALVLRHGGRGEPKQDVQDTAVAEIEVEQAGILGEDLGALKCASSANVSFVE